MCDFSAREEIEDKRGKMGESGTAWEWKKIKGAWERLEEKK